jgi:hypothetical protein
VSTDVAFVVAPFRSGSTAVWNVCRSIDNVTAFYEPLHEALPSLVGQPRAIDPTHDGVDEDYFAEYRTLDPAWLAVAHRAASEYAHTAMISSRARRALTAYVDGLASSTTGTTVFQFNRACLAIPTLAELWPDAPIIAVTRPIAERLRSARGHAGQSFDWYEARVMHELDPGVRTSAAVRVPRIATGLARFSPRWFQARAAIAQDQFERDAGNHADAVFEHCTLRNADLASRVVAALQLGAVGQPAEQS